LKCYQRPKKSFEKIPGCKEGGDQDVAGHDYCYGTGVWLPDGWAIGDLGGTCDSKCAETGRACSSAEPTALTTNAKVAAAFAEAGYTCPSFHGARDYPGAPFSKLGGSGGSAGDCAPFESGGASSSCSTNTLSIGAPLCYCKALPSPLPSQTPTEHPTPAPTPAPTDPPTTLPPTLVPTSLPVTPAPLSPAPVTSTADVNLEHKGGSGCTPSNKCTACQGDCDVDGDCATGLKCFQRSASEKIPGCKVGGNGDVNKHDYCYAPSASLRR